MVVACSGRHLEHNIVQRCRLSDLPVNTSRRVTGRLTGNIDNEVPDGAIAIIMWMSISYRSNNNYVGAYKLSVSS